MGDATVEEPLQATGDVFVVVGPPRAVCATFERLSDAQAYVTRDDVGGARGSWTDVQRHEYVSVHGVYVIWNQTIWSPSGRPAALDEPRL